MELIETDMAGRSPCPLRVRLVPLLLAFGLLVLAPPVDAAAQDPAVVAERLNGTLHETMMAAKELGYRGRFEKLEPVLREVFDFPFMTRAAVGRSWSELDPAEQDQLIELFSNMSIATFAARFDGYGGETFETLGERDGPRGTILVETELVRPDDKPVGLNYLLRASDDDWRIIDVFLDSKFSELARQRAEFSAVLKDRGYDGLVAKLEDKIERLAKEG
jgi:phospholipid transport system substrate-binding protein